MTEERGIDPGTADDLPGARVVPRSVRDPFRWYRRGLFAVVLTVGCVFILYANRFYVTAPAMFMCLAYLAALATVWTLWRTGVVAADDDDAWEAAWVAIPGKRGDLLREKKTLLRSIKEAEFDHDTGKLSKADADQMIAMYRARAIEVIKELDHLGDVAPSTTRQQIEREIKARVEIAARSARSKGDGGERTGSKDRRTKGAMR